MAFLTDHKEESLPLPRKGIFTTTCWTMVSMARKIDGTDRMGALENLCTIYRPAIYAFIRGKGQSVEDAEDLTQQFFLHFLTKNTLARAETSQGKFRTFLLTCVSNFIRDEFRRSQAQKRGGNITFHALHDVDPAASEPAPDFNFNRKWAETVIDHALEQIEKEWTQRQRQQHFLDLKCFLVESRGHAPMAEKAAEMGISKNALKTAIHRLRKRYATLVRQILAETIPEDDSVEEELNWLLETLAL